uniref:Flagellar L-ring protein n=1 Tax=Lygus hesperus TaxID=30085 RepID=A0A0A9YRQ6_LYGHE
MSNFSQCSTLYISDVVDGRLQEIVRINRDEKSRSRSTQPPGFAFKDYIVTLETTPGGGLFEATVRHLLNSEFSVVGVVKRLNINEIQSRCISDNSLKYYCYCRYK